MSAYGPGMDTILLELEAAIKNSYMAEFEDFIKAEVSTNSEKEIKENPLPSKILDCDNEEMLIKALSEFESDIELKNMLKIEEQAYLNLFEDREKVYSTLYHQSTNRISFLVRVLKNLANERNLFIEKEVNYVVETSKEEMINSYKERVKHLNNRIVSLQGELANSEIELEDRKEMYSKLSHKYEDLVYELEMFKGNEKLFKRLEIETLFKFEEDMQNSLKVVAKIKNEKILDCLNDLKHSKQAVEDSKKCIICHESQACILLKPCNHANVCEGCSLKLTICPIDRTVILTQERIFL